MSQSLKIFIVDDSSFYRKLMTQAVEGLSIETKVETAPLGTIALKKIPIFQPDIVLLDIEMPDMNGIEVLAAIRRDHPHVNVILVSGVNSRSADITIEGLSSGASDFISKPMGNNMGESAKELRESLEKAIGMILNRREVRAARAADRLVSGAASSSLAAKTAVTPKPRRGPSLLPARVEIVAVGVSTGGPVALEKMLPQLPADLPVPIVIVQHMPPVFTESLARALDKHSKLSVCEARDGQVLEKGTVYLAKGGMHMTIKRNPKGSLVVAMNDGPPVNSCKPAVDVLFHSLVTATAGHTVAVVMTGMGQDGLEGARAIKDAAGYVLTQSEETCTVYGMPHAVDEAALSDESVPLDDLAARICYIVSGALR